ncbi:MAG TPA: retropepsin-like aspartic protease [Candidatus Acidoferrales bacterium]|nr:retropepsin-like aspartic protease [Candidatus Acidoferrales bacterium]
MRRALTAGTMLGAIAAAAFALLPLSAHAETRIPFTDVDGGLVQVQATLDGRLTVPMLVDLGGGIDVLATDVAKRLGLAPTGRFTSWRMSGERVDTPTARLSSITVGSFRIDDPVVGTWDGLNGTGIGGLISATAFRNVPVTFDFANDVLILEDPASLAERIRHGARAPLVLQDDRGISLGLFAPFDFGDGQQGLCEIDTGSQGYFLDPRFATPLGVDLADPSLKHVHGSSTDSIVAPIPQLVLHGAPATAKEKPPVMFANLIYDCNVGNEFWKNDVVTFDIPGRALYVNAGRDTPSQR